jgi:hypothetical protein
MWVVLWRERTHAHEFPGADLDEWNAEIVMEMRDDFVCHVLRAILPANPSSASPFEPDRPGAGINQLLPICQRRNGFPGMRLGIAISSVHHYLTVARI